MSWQLGAEQAAALLVHRCRLIAFEDDIDEIALRHGDPSACLPILRYLFTGFSEALSDMCDAAEHNFSADMSDAALLGGIIGVWPMLSPEQPSLGSVTVAKLLQPNAWGLDRLLFTLQCVFVCCRAHAEAVSQQDAALFAGIEWTNTSPQQQFDDHPNQNGTESQRLASAVAWMAEAYREQLNSVGGEAAATLGPSASQNVPPVATVIQPQSKPDPLDVAHRAIRQEAHAPPSPQEACIAGFDAGAAEQAAWIARLRNGNPESTVGSAASMSTIVPMVANYDEPGGRTRDEVELLHGASAPNELDWPVEKRALLVKEEGYQARVAYVNQLDAMGLHGLAAKTTIVGLDLNNTPDKKAELEAMSYRRAMREVHFLDEPIPGAPALQPRDLAGVSEETMRLIETPFIR